MAVVTLSTILLMAASAPAHADIMTTAVQWFYTNFAIGIVSAAILICGVMMLAGRMGLVFGVSVIAGALVIGNYSTIVSAVMGSASGGGAG